MLSLTYDTWIKGPAACEPLASKQGKILPSPQHSHEPRAREGIKKYDLRGEIQIGKEDLPRREGGDTFTLVSSQVCNTFHSQERLESWYFLTLECSHLMAGVPFLKRKISSGYLI